MGRKIWVLGREFIDVEDSSCQAPDLLPVYRAASGLVSLASNHPVESIANCATRRASSRFSLHTPSRWIENPLP